MQTIFPPFLWSVASQYFVATWCGYELRAFADGAWSVRRGNAMLIGSVHQVPGSNIKDAMRRAQAAAIVQHSLRGNTNPHD